MIDLRSDTVTKPSAAMREAMSRAEVGDDVFGEDPTVRRLEERAAELLGMHAALFVPTGTMGNQIAIAVHTRPGEEVIVEERCHILHYEMGAMAALSGVLPRVLPSDDGILDPGAVEAAVRPDLSYLPRTGLLALENTHNSCGGTVMTAERKDALLEAARARGLPVHLDGARIWNAAAALDVPASRLVAGCDSVMFCLSKGLGAPVGSLLLGSAALVAEARRVRKRFGGGMRQVGVLAAAGLVALENRGRLADDHERARRIAEAVAEIPGASARHGGTNIVMVDLGPGVPGAAAVVERLAARGVGSIPFGPRTVRLVTHLDVDDAGIGSAIAALRDAIAG